MNILTVNLALSTFVFWVAAKLYVVPKLQDYEARTILLPILLLHSLRHLVSRVGGHLSWHPATVYSSGSLRRSHYGRPGDDLDSSGRCSGAERETLRVGFQPRGVARPY